MVKRVIPLFLIVWFWMGKMAAQSCCNTGSISSCGSSTGLLTSLKNNTASLRALLAPFRTTTSIEENFRDYFYVLELSLRYEFSPRIKVFLQQPYRWNVRTFANEKQVLEGIADSRLGVSFALLDNCPCGKFGKLYWELGAGVKLPTGKYDQSIYYRDLPGNFNIGTGNTGYLLLTNLLFTRKNAGLSLSGAYQLSGRSRDDYQYGDLFTATTAVFKEWALGEKWSLVPFVGTSVDIVGKNYLPSGNFAEGSGGEGWFALAGLNTRFDDWQFGLTTSRPFYQHYAGRVIAAKQRYSFELTLFF